MSTDKKDMTMPAEKRENENMTYRPVIFVIFTYAVTWACAVGMSVYAGPEPVMAILDFTKSASPLIAALLLLRPYMEPGFGRRFFLGKRAKAVRYGAVAFLFVFQFLNFRLFSTGSGMMTAGGVLSVFAGQIIFGGALEEGGWRGYLQPALERRMPVLVAAACVGLIWAAWHLPYFILPGTMHTAGNFLMYTVTTMITGVILTAIHKLTGSVLLCTLFHGFQNTVVMLVPADMGSVGFILMFLILGALSAWICVKEGRGTSAP